MIEPSLRLPQLDPTDDHGRRSEPAEPLRSSGGEASRRRLSGFVFAALCAAATWLSCAVLAVLLAAVVVQAWGWLDLQFLTSFDSRKPERAGLFAGLWGTFWLILLTILFSVPIGMAAAVYLEEYASDTWITRLIRVNIANLAGVPGLVLPCGFSASGLPIGLQLQAPHFEEGRLLRLGHALEQELALCREPDLG